MCGAAKCASIVVRTLTQGKEGDKEMDTRHIARLALIAGTATTLASVPAMAQVVTFSTSGSFSGGSCGATSCSFGGFVLTYNGLSAASWTAPTNVNFGSFSVVCNPCAPGTTASILPGSTFTLTITQTGPAPGTGTFTGTLVGGLGWNPSASNLFMMPNQSTIVIAGVTYGLIETDQGGGNFGVDIIAPNVNNDPTGTIFKARITASTVPEPATLVLMATGLLGFIPVARRRRLM
jgi:hypothetical protein